MFALLALGSSLVWGASDYAAGVLSKKRPAVAVVGWSQTFAAAVLTVIVWLRVVSTGNGVGAGWIGPAVLGGLCGAMALTCLYAALSRGSMGVVAPIASLGVVVPVVVGLARGDAPGWLALVGIIIAIAGVVCASGPELSGGAPIQPILLAAIAGVGFGVVLLCLDAGADASVLHTLWGMRLTTAALFIAASLRFGRGGIERADHRLLFLIGMGDMTANALFGLATSSGMVSVASVLGSLYPVVTVLLARSLLGEHLRQIQWIGVGLTALGAALLAV